MGLVGSAVLTLAACGLADSHAPVPEFMRAHEPDKSPQSSPDVKQLVRDQLNSVFVNTSSPHDVRVSQPLHDPRGSGKVNSATGKPIGTETYRITISEGQIVDRRRDNDNCISETYQPI
jgi:hypothetical protein